MTETQTIAALATAPAPAGIAVVRVSGPKTRTALRALFKGKKNPVDDPRRLIFGELIDSQTNEVIDTCMAVFMPGPFSFTGEDIGEFQFHGSPILVEKVLRSLFAYGVTPAEPGEFSKRAFLNGKIDLVQAEAIADLIAATSEEALKLASEQLKGKFSHAIQEIGEPLRDVLAEIEASIDFPEEDIEPAKVESMLGTIRTSKQKIEDLLKTYQYGHTVREGFRVLLCGKPNAGKSSILNLLVGKQRAIVTDISGTTRDLIEEEITLGGYKFVLCDSAGIRETDDTVEKIGVELALSRLEWADLVLCIADATDEGGWKDLVELLKGKAKKIWMITNKIDLNPTAIGKFFCDSSTCQQNLYISAKTKSGFDTLTQALVEEVSSKIGGGVETNTILTNERHQSCLLKASESLSVILSQKKLPLEIISAELRVTLTSLQELVGKTTTEDILGRIFSKFCIGK